MPKYEIKWNMFGVFEVEAKDADDALEYFDDAMFGGLDRDGLDYEIAEV